MSRGVDYPGILSREALAGCQTAERRRRLGLTRRELAGASGVALARLAGHENGRFVLTADEREALDVVLSSREQEHGLPSVGLSYVPASDVQPTEAEQILLGIVRTLFGSGPARRAADEAMPDTPPPKEETTGAPHPVVSCLSSTTTTTAQRSDLGDDHARLISSYQPAPLPGRPYQTTAPRPMTSLLPAASRLCISTAPVSPSTQAVPSSALLC